MHWIWWKKNADKWIWTKNWDLVKKKKQGKEFKNMQSLCYHSNIKDIAITQCCQKYVRGTKDEMGETPVVWLDIIKKKLQSM